AARSATSPSPRRPSWPLSSQRSRRSWRPRRTFSGVDATERAMANHGSVPVLGEMQPRKRRDTGAPRADLPSFTRALFLGDIRHEFLFPFPDPLEKRNPEEGALVRRLIGDLRKLERDLINSAKYDAEQTIPEN